MRLILPETGGERAANAQMSELELDCRGISGEVAPNVAGADMEPAYPATFALSSDQHTPSSRSSLVGKEHGMKNHGTISRYLKS